MKKKLKLDRNMQLFWGFVFILIFLFRLSREGLSGLAIVNGIVGVLSFLLVYKSHKEITKIWEVAKYE